MVAWIINVSATAVTTKGRSLTLVSMTTISISAVAMTTKGRAFVSMTIIISTVAVTTKGRALVSMATRLGAVTMATIQRTPVPIVAKQSCVQVRISRVKHFRARVEEEVELQNSDHVGRYEEDVCVVGEGVLAENAQEEHCGEENAESEQWLVDVGEFGDGGGDQLVVTDELAEEVLGGDEVEVRTAGRGAGEVGERSWGRKTLINLPR